MPKQRLDVYLTEHGLAPSRERARAVIMAGLVFVDGQKADKAGQPVSGKESIEVRGGSQKYVSRGGLKLEKALTAFEIGLTGKVCMDVGASTGGFTDCMLQNGAGKVYAVDVGYGQLAWSLRNDSRVVNIERTNIRYIDEALIEEPIDFISIDVSFISLKLVIPAAVKFLKDDGGMVALIKPQFEAGCGQVGKKGVVREPEIHKQVIENVIEFCKNENLRVCGLDFSPIRGPEGNIEYLLYLRKTGDGIVPDVAETVRKSHES